MTIAVTTTIGGAQVTRQYVDEVNIGPAAAGDVGFTFIVGDQGAKYSWALTSAKGY